MQKGAATMTNSSNRMMTLDDVRFEVTRTLQSAAFLQHKKEIPAGLCFDCGAELFDAGTLDQCPKCESKTISRVDAEIMGRKPTAAMLRAREALDVTEIMAERFGFVTVFPTDTPLKKARASSVEATRPAGAFPAFGVQWDTVFPTEMAELAGASSVAELFPGVTLAKRCAMCAVLFPATEGETCEACSAAHAEALEMDAQRVSTFDADAFYRHMDELDAFEDWMDAIGGDEALAEMDDDTIAELVKLDAEQVAAELAQRETRQQKAGS
jgi:hypothetical protein